MAHTIDNMCQVTEYLRRDPVAYNTYIDHKVYIIQHYRHQFSYFVLIVTSYLYSGPLPSLNGSSRKRTRHVAKNTAKMLDLYSGALRV